MMSMVKVVFFAASAVNVAAIKINQVAADDVESVFEVAADVALKPTQDEKDIHFQFKKEALKAANQEKPVKVSFVDAAQKEQVGKVVGQKKFSKGSATKFLVETSDGVTVEKMIHDLTIKKDMTKEQRNSRHMEMNMGYKSNSKADLFKSNSMKKRRSNKKMASNKKAAADTKVKNDDVEVNWDHFVGAEIKNVEEKTPKLEMSKNQLFDTKVTIESSVPLTEEDQGLGITILKDTVSRIESVSEGFAKQHTTLANYIGWDIVKINGYEVDTKTLTQMNRNQFFEKVQNLEQGACVSFTLRKPIVQ
jgi:hypothetical protein